MNNIVINSPDGAAGNTHISISNGPELRGVSAATISVEAGGVWTAKLDVAPANVKIMAQADLGDYLVQIFKHLDAEDMEKVMPALMQARTLDEFRPIRAIMRAMDKLGIKYDAESFAAIKAPEGDTTMLRTPETEDDLKFVMEIISRDYRVEFRRDPMRREYVAEPY